MATMQKWQMEHFEDKVKRQFNPLIEDQELLIRQYRTEATNKAVDKLAKKMGADKIINDFRKAEKNLADARASAITFFDKKKPKDKELNYQFTSRSSDRLELSDCEEQLRDWASNLVDKEIEKRPEGSKLAHLKELKCKAMDTIKECGSPEALAVALDKVSNKIGITWNTDIKAIPQIK
jgi:hypothetical protein|tara:strand:+ start:263 stop:799 length:537 start_codon:yes stop_codon:yes gene_type:complete